MESIGFPPTLAQGMAELAEVISGPGNYLEAVGIVKGREVGFYLGRNHESVMLMAVYSRSSMQAIN